MNNPWQAVLDFWFKEIEPQAWWVKDNEFDQLIKARFLHTHQAACQGELFSWRHCAQGRLAEIIVLDQFSRNLFRDQPECFAADGIALVLAQEAIQDGTSEQLTIPERTFLYMPFMHSESLLIHEQAVSLFSQPEIPEENLDFELKHKAILERFGRYPHRNAILGRTSTAEEIAFLQQPGSSF